MLCICETGALAKTGTAVKSKAVTAAKSKAVTAVKQELQQLLQNGELQAE